jgi:hypothetical protein
MDRMKVRGDTLLAELWYPRSDGEPQYVEIDLVDVRASDGIRVSYDFERDGWVIEQRSQFGNDETTGKILDPNWTEVAFVQSWALDNSCDNFWCPKPAFGGGLCDDCRT